MTRFIVLLPEMFPGREDDAIELREAYRGVARGMRPIKSGAGIAGKLAAVTDASTLSGAITHVVFRNFADQRADCEKALPRLLASVIFNSGEYDVYEVPEVENADGTPITDVVERRRSEEVFLAEDIAKRKRIEKIDAIKSARELLALVQPY